MGKQYAGHAREMRRLYPGDENEDGRNGLLDLRCLGSPVIEVAEDLQTAKGMWYAPTVATECHPGEERPAGHALWMKFAVDFIREDGVWKIWHYHALPSFNTPWGKDWVEASLAAEARMANLPPEAKAAMAPKGPITAYHAYSVHAAPACDPPPPEPYGTFSETFRY